MLTAVHSKWWRCIAALIAPAFVVAHLFCVCTVYALAAAPSAAGKASPAGHTDEHCHPDGSSKGSSGKHAPECGHCGGAELATAPPQSTPGAPVTFSLIALSDPYLRSLELPAALRSSEYRRSPPVARPLDLKCVLLI